MIYLMIISNNWLPLIIITDYFTLLFYVNAHRLLKSFHDDIQQ